MAYEYTAKVTKWVDGDTVWLELTKNATLTLDFGFRIYRTITEVITTVQDFRLFGIDTPELKGATLEAGRAARAKLQELMGLGPLRVETFKPDKYGRWLARIYVKLADGSELCVNDELVRTGHAVPYMEG